MANSIGVALEASTKAAYAYPRRRYRFRHPGDLWAVLPKIRHSIISQRVTELLDFCPVSFLGYLPYDPRTELLVQNNLTSEESGPELKMRAFVPAHRFTMPVFEMNILV